MDVPTTSVRLNIVPIKIFINSKELNLSQKMEMHPIESTLKNKLSADGCAFTNKPELSDYVLTIESNTKSEGIIWGNMKTASFNMTISLIEQTQNIEIYRNGLREIKGFQTTDVNAGIDAYKNAIEQLMQKIYPSLSDELLKGG
jgi:hypothetical protein